MRVMGVYADAKEAKMKRVCVIGCSDGIGLATVQALLADGWAVVGLSRSVSPVHDAHYRHETVDVTAREYSWQLSAVLAEAPLDALIYCAGVGERLDLANLEREVKVFEINLLAAVATAAVAVPVMLAAGGGHLIVLSSLADSLVSAETPSYNASKAALSNYFDGLGLRLRQNNIAVSFIRFGFVDTKMAKSPARPFMVSRQRAAQVVLRTLRTRQRRVSFPWQMRVLVAVLPAWQALKRLFS